MTHVTYQEPGSARNPTLGNRAWATFTFYSHLDPAHVDSGNKMHVYLWYLTR